MFGSLLATWPAWLILWAMFFALVGFTIHSWTFYRRDFNWIHWFLNSLWISFVVGLSFTTFVFVISYYLPIWLK